MSLQLMGGSTQTKHSVLVHFYEEHEELTVRAAEGEMDVWEIAGRLKVTERGGDRVHVLLTITFNLT
ncbi:hypothetical protein ACSFCW_26305 [Yokenella regensburgei]|uniref:hypothetical protein n=1 Tax=Yokenella regensburgei TaxID=158877 RepID=UPI003ED9B344